MGAFFTVLVAFGFCLGLAAYAEETITEKAATLTDEAVDSVKKTYRKAEDVTCEMVNGKKECRSKKMKHEAENALDASETKAKELQKKVD